MYLALILLLIPAVQSLQCYFCGPYLSATSNQCKGQPRAIDCTASKGCIYSYAKKEDGTYFVEKRCSYLEENNNIDGECIDSVIDGVNGKQCFCTSDLCNAGGKTSALSLWLTVSLTFLLVVLLQ